MRTAFALLFLLAACGGDEAECADCDAVCGDDQVSGSEDCDGDTDQTCLDLGFYQDGAVTCRDDCTFDTSSCLGFCGDGVRDDEFEDCEGGDLGDAVDCTDLGFDEPNAISCTATCTYDTTQCDY